MDKETPAVNTTEPAAVQTDTITVDSGDYESRISTLEAEKNRLIEESANWKMAAMKAKSKQVDFSDENESDDDRMRRIATEAVANSRLAEITREQEAIIKKALRENSELKLAISNKTGVSASTGSHTESVPVVGTQITPEQLTAFKAKGWSDKDIERYKKNLRRYAGT
jgi:lysozyme family protein